MKSTFFLVIFTILISFSKAQVCDNPPDQLQTRPSDIPYLVPEHSGFLSLDTFNLGITSTLVNLRSDAVIVLNENDATCNYPGTYWTHSNSTSNCTESWEGTFGFDVFSAHCGANRTETPTEIIYYGTAQITQIDTLGAIRGVPITRQLITNVRYEIIFPKTYQITSPSIQVFSPINVIAAVTKQSFNPLTKLGDLNLYTSVQYPFELVKTSINVNNPNLTVSIIGNVTNCPANKPCETTFDIQVNPNALCYLNGQYNLSFALACNPAFVGDCPLQGEAGSIIFQIASENLCGLFIENIDVSGTLSPFLADYTTSKSAFLLGQNVYWKLDVISKKATIISTTLTDLYSNFNGTSNIYLYQGSAVTLQGLGVQFTLDGNGGLGTESRFHYLVDNSIYPVPTDENLPAKITATVSIVYQNTVKRSLLTKFLLDPSFLKRQPTKSQPFSSNSLISVQPPQTSVPAPTSVVNGNPTIIKGDVSSNNPNSAFNLLIYVIVAVCVACIFISIAAFIIYKKRRSNSYRETQDQM